MENQNTPLNRVLRGKFRSLTLINWNGFFARTFDIDALVTTLSGGNGAGKSTTMAAFVTALIPDLTLLHFRNTTEAGASGGSRDRGLHGKLKAGVCYAVLEAENSRHERILMGVRLQQVAGRDKKVDLKTFSLLNLPAEISPTALLTEVVSGQQARVLSLIELAEKVEQYQTEFKQYHSISDYHAVMFDLGMLPKRLRSAADRAKFYKLIEASLYGGISSAITRSLRDYLLPDNQSVKKAFEDMESALRENRMTLEAIKMTQGDRDLFKHLITETTQYVAADYMRNANERRGNVEKALEVRRALFQAKTEQDLAQHRLVEFSREAAMLAESEGTLEQEHQAAADFLNLVLNASRHQEKIDRYQDDVAELREKVEEQQIVLAEMTEEEEAQQAALEDVDAQIEALRDELADYQQALDAQQTRALQYQQASQALEKAKTQCGLPQLTPENSAEFFSEFDQQLETMMETVLDFEQKMAISDTAKNQFDNAYQLLQKMVGKVARENAWQVSQNLLSLYPQYKIQAQLAPSLRSKLQDLEKRLAQQKNAAQQLREFNQRTGLALKDATVLADYAEEKTVEAEELEATLIELTEKRSTLRQQQATLNAQTQEKSTLAPSWLVAQSALERLSEQSESQFSSSQEVTQFMQTLLEKERSLVAEREKLAIQRQKLDEQIACLSLPDGADDPRLTQLAERFQGVLLSELYEDVSVEDAPFFSALYGPSRHAIVVRDLNAIKNELIDLQDCPADLYFIEGDPTSFDDNVYTSEELKCGVIVQVSERELRYSTFPDIPLFGRAAREKQLACLQAERETVQEAYARVAFDVQKCQRLSEHFSQFVGLHLALAFQPNPETLLAEIQQQRNEVERELTQVQNQQQQAQQQLSILKGQLQLLAKITPMLDLLADDQLTGEYDLCRNELVQAEEGEQFVQQHQATMIQFMPIAAALRSDPANYDQMVMDFAQIQQKQKQLQQYRFLIGEVVQRRAHFAYTDIAMVESSDLNKQLRAQLEQAQQQRESLRESVRQKSTRVTQYRQVLIELNSALQEKNKMLQELISEIGQLGVRVDANIETTARERRDNLQQRLVTNRQRRQFVEKQLTLIESESENLTREIRKAERDYHQQREIVVAAKISWEVALHLSRQANMEKRLNRREFAYLSSEELRSMSDKALGALRIAVTDNEYLRDSLRASEDNRKPENKIRFFIAVYQHLRERIRQDIIKTDDPIDAIEQMEVELARLTEELTSREKKLAISAESVANIMRKTIQREQNRIRILNQGLQNIAFGQVKSVRLVVDIRESHATLLDALSVNKNAHQDLFNDNRITFSEAMAKLYQRLNPQIEIGQSSMQTIGETLLDYRNYLDLEVEVFRGADGWLRAESGALSTGEAIGTGMSILLMVVQSWEEESRRIRAKDILPCRLLFLDEAARLDAKSIATLFELCERLDMQLLIAAPENISPEKGTTYKLMRKITNNHEHVHVVGLRGFGTVEN